MLCSVTTTISQRGEPKTLDPRFLVWQLYSTVHNNIARADTIYNSEPIQLRLIDSGIKFLDDLYLSVNLILWR